MVSAPDRDVEQGRPPGRQGARDRALEGLRVVDPLGVGAERLGRLVVARAGDLEAVERGAAESALDLDLGVPARVVADDGQEGQAVPNGRVDLGQVVADRPVAEEGDDARLGAGQPGAEREGDAGPDRARGAVQEPGRAAPEEGQGGLGPLAELSAVADEDVPVGEVSADGRGQPQRVHRPGRIARERRPAGPAEAGRGDDLGSPARIGDRPGRRAGAGGRDDGRRVGRARQRDRQVGAGEGGADGDEVDVGREERLAAEAEAEVGPAAEQDDQVGAGEDRAGRAEGRVVDAARALDRQRRRAERVGQALDGRPAPAARHGRASQQERAAGRAD
jgi:hypothetical protein